MNYVTFRERFHGFACFLNEQVFAAFPPINTMLPSMPIRLSGTRRFTDFSAHAAKMAALHIAPPGLAAGEIMVRNA